MCDVSKPGNGCFTFFRFDFTPSVCYNEWKILSEILLQNYLGGNENLALWISPKISSWSLIVIKSDLFSNLVNVATHTHTHAYIYIYMTKLFTFILAQMLLGKGMKPSVLIQICVNTGANWALQPWHGYRSRWRKTLNYNLFKLRLKMTLCVNTHTHTHTHIYIWLLSCVIITKQA